MSMTSTKAQMDPNFKNHLTRANVAEINATTTNNDTSFAESLVRREGIQLYERASHYWIHSSNPGNQNGSDFQDHAMEQNTSIESISRQYPETAARTTAILERFSFLSPQNEPFAMHAKTAMAEMNIAEGSLEKLELRAHAARAVAFVRRSDRDCDSVEAVASGASSEADASDAPHGELHVIVNSDGDQEQGTAAESNGNISYARAAAARADNRLVEERQRVNRHPRVRRRANGGERKRRKLG